MAMTRAEFSDYIVNQCGKITRYVVGEFRKTRAHAAGKSEVYRIDEDGIEHVRKSGLVVSVPCDIKTVATQAKALHQCLVSADYIGRMAEKELVLVFVRTKSGEPVATAEIKPDGSLGQFYADEDKDDIKPSEKAHIALDAWLKEYRAKAKRSMKKTQKEAA